jgi:N-(2-amino-2-carboxyethyl)-L-glutamate synthase
VVKIATPFFITFCVASGNDEMEVKMKKKILDFVGNTPLVILEDDELQNINLYAKLEGFNPTGSIKDRAATYVLKQLLDSHEINTETTIVESSSGNFAISLASYCKKYGLKFCAVIDANILPINERIIRGLATEVIKVSCRDETGGFLLTRLDVIRKLLETREKCYWMNQYGNPYVAHAYSDTIGNEICNQLKIDYIFVGVSSSGTITGISQKVKEIYPNAQVIAVDSEGSLIFGNKPHPRHIPGIGSSMRPKLIEHAKIDDVVIVEECDAILSCYELVDKHNLLVGGSSGSVYTAVKHYFEGKTFRSKPNVVCIFADKGDRYSQTIYNEQWVRDKFES